MMKLGRLINIAFILVLITFMFHILAMGYNRWKIIRCKSCSGNVSVHTIYTSLTQRCYLSSFSLDQQSLSGELCLSNKFLYPKKKGDAELCLNETLDQQYTECSSHTYSKQCHCDYALGTKIILALTIVAAILLGLTILITHFMLLSAEKNIILFVIGETFLIISFLAILIALILVGVYKTQDIDELKYKRTLNAMSGMPINSKELGRLRNSNYSITVGYSVGLEIIALFFTLGTAIFFIFLLWVRGRSGEQSAESD
ncbi:unnamed protein product [Didymodactylos carnosus]|uniref:Uncharacterized protein n=1 Tax=Didymodactylos carnosus TaxID=1234261 RepID=A0A814QQQ6_9BILA|nr:unnamed protein product [Didymodactylos carnosus]CAF1122903.1 unnamed protein product [Didymodactylos carnosus]CAF3847729.1 unnamed protein product [Didymodactylos carnosus]CAF3886431.1 unnamed protein product [Didymodactylos carnosus]